jgi:hypothetical protein
MHGFDKQGLPGVEQQQEAASLCVETRLHAFSPSGEQLCLYM